MYMIRKAGETKLQYRLTFEIELFRLLTGVRFLSGASLNSTFSVVIFSLFALFSYSKAFMCPQFQA